MSVAKLWGLSAGTPASNDSPAVANGQKEAAMSSTATQVPPVIHPSFWARAATWVVNEAKTVKSTILKIAGLEPSISAAIQKAAPTLEAISNLVIPGSGNFEAHLINVWSVAASAVDAAGAADAANGVNIQLDAALVSQIKSFIPAVKAQMTGNPSAAPN